MIALAAERMVAYDVHIIGCGVSFVVGALFYRMLDWLIKKYW